VSDNLTPEQREQLSQWLAEGQRWNSIGDAIALIEKHLGTAPGRTTGLAQKLWKDARASGEVRFANDDKEQRSRYDYACRQDDLISWLDRHHPGQAAQPAQKQAGLRKAPDGVVRQFGLSTTMVCNQTLMSCPRLCSRA
jgi:hypothetical protein